MTVQIKTILLFLCVTQVSNLLSPYGFYQARNAPKNPKIQNWKKWNIWPRLFWVVLIISLNVSPSAVACHPLLLDGILNLCTKFDVLSFTKFKFREWVLNIKVGHVTVTRPLWGNSSFVVHVKYLSWSTCTPNLKCHPQLSNHQSILLKTH